MSKRITITIHDDIDDAFALIRAAELVQRVPDKSGDLYWEDGIATGYSYGAKQTAIHVYKSRGYEVFKDMKFEDK